LRLVFVGNLIRRKGIDILAAAVRELAQEGIPVTLDVYGPGEVAMLGEASSAVRYRGRIPFGETGRTISGYDVLVLPSLHDGWGVVVNEAIQAGVPVACTGQVGASALVGHWGCGWVFDNPTVVSIKTGIRRLAAERASLAVARTSAVAAASTLSPEIAGRYMYDAVRSVEDGTAPPPCPWYA
jgi:glycosyltransferase involved in cell wall biosynthesis